MGAETMPQNEPLPPMMRGCRILSHLLTSNWTCRLFRYRLRVEDASSRATEDFNDDCWTCYVPFASLMED